MAAHGCTDVHRLHLQPYCCWLIDSARRICRRRILLTTPSSTDALQPSAALLFQMVEDIIAVCDMVDVRECFAHMRRLLSLAARSVQATLQVQRATKQLLTRFSGTSDPGIRGEVSLSTLRV